MLNRVIACIMLITLVFSDECYDYPYKHCIYNHKQPSDIVYHSISDKARGMGDWNDGKESYDYCDGLAGSTDC